MRFLARSQARLQRTLAFAGAARGPLGWIVLSLSLAGILSQFYRSSTAVIAPDLRRELGLAPEALGILTGAFFLAFALGQIPAGILIDRYGARRTISAILLVVIVGAIAFAAGRDLPMLAAARVLMGLGCAGIMMASFIVSARWFDPRYFTLAVALLIAVSNAGVLLATSPMAVVVNAIGWRATFWVMVGITALVTAMVYLRVQDAPPGHAYEVAPRESLRQVLGGVWEVLTNRQLPYVLAITFVGYGTLVTVIALWGAPYLIDVHGLDRAGAGHVLFFMVLASIAGNVSYGLLERWLGTPKRPALIGASASALILAALAAAPQADLRIVVPLLVALGGFNAFSPVVIAHGRSLFPDRLVGRGMTTVNFFNMLGAGALQLATGAIVGGFARAGDAAGPQAYRAMFAFLAAGLVLALLIYSRARDPTAPSAPKASSSPDA